MVKLSRGIKFLLNVNFDTCMGKMKFIPFPIFLVGNIEIGSEFVVQRKKVRVENQLSLLTRDVSFLSSNILTFNTC